MVEPLTSYLTTVETASVRESLKPRVILNFVTPVLTPIEATRVPERVMIEPLASRILIPQQNRKNLVPHLTFLTRRIITERTLSTVPTRRELVTSTESTQIPEDTLTNSISDQLVEPPLVHPTLIASESTETASVPEHVMVELLTSRILNSQQNRKYVGPHLTFLEPEIVTERALSTQIPEDTLTNSITGQFVELSLTRPTLTDSESPTTLETHISPEPVSEMNTITVKNKLLK
jgi:hypothetical protein